MPKYEITIFKNIRAAATPFYRDVSTIFERIKEGKDLSLINQVRFEKDRVKRNELKEQLPSIVFSGKFRHRNAQSLIKHSGLIVIDMDSFKDDKELALYRKAFLESPTKSKYTFALFTSPSGLGLKVIIRIPPCTPSDHKLYFKALKEFYNDPHFDESGSDVCRVCYISYDPDIYINYESEVWTEKEDNESYDLSEKTPILRLKTDIGVVGALQKWFDKKYTMDEGGRNANLFKLASAHNDFGVTKSEAERYLVSRYKSKTFPEREIINLIKSAYQKPGGTKFFEDKQAIELLERQIRSGADHAKIYKKLKDEGGHSKEDVENAIKSISDSLPISEFWHFTSTGKCVIDNHKFKAFLEQRGFYKYYPEGSENFVFVKIENNMIENVTTTQIKDFVLDYLHEQSSIQPYELMSGNSKYFKEDYLNLISKADIHFFEDTLDKGVIYFKNGAVILKTSSKTETEQTILGPRKKIIRTTKVELMDYLQLEGSVWKHQIIDRDFKEADYTNCDYSKFINLIAGKDDKSELAIKSTIGYLMHSFKTSANNKAVILNDATISDNPNGGSGKGIFCNAIGKVKKLAVLNGKTFDSMKSFAYQTVQADTQVLLYDDIPKNFSFEDLFSVVTEGITLEKKNKDAIKLPVGKSPKIIITTNYTIGGVGGSFERRKWEMEFSSYFNSNHTPLNEFGKLLFDEWDELEWSKFDSFMIDCFKIYLENGLIRQEYTNLAERKFIKETSFDFHEWVNEEPLPVMDLIVKSEYFERFTKEYSDYKNFKWFNQKRFSTWLEIYGKYKGYKCMVGKSMGNRWIKFIPEGATNEDIKQSIVTDNIVLANEKEELEF